MIFFLLSTVVNFLLVARAAIARAGASFGRGFLFVNFLGGFFIGHNFTINFATMTV
jgi:hypothetical protein